MESFMKIFKVDEVHKFIELTNKNKDLDIEVNMKEFKKEVAKFKEEKMEIEKGVDELTELIKGIKNLHS
jgi:hypothetical protein